MQKLQRVLSMIKVQHSIFALPFALVSLFVASAGTPSLKNFVGIVLAMVTARNVAMSFNRIVDAKMDAQNPRTQNREIPSGKLSKNFTIGFCVVNALLFILICFFFFNTLTFTLSPIALLIVMSYSLTKRFTHYTQLFLGLALGSAPLAAWIAVTGNLSFYACLLGLGVLFWAAGFDLIYSTMDYDFDRAHGVKNWVAKLGPSKALWRARVLHVLAIVSFFASALFISAGVFYYLGLAVMAGLLIYEHRLVRPDDLSKVNMAFFTLNGYVAISFFCFVLADLYF